MKALFDQVTEDYSELVTRRYSTSFSSAVRMLHTSIRQDIYNIYGFVRFADAAQHIVVGNTNIFKGDDNGVAGANAELIQAGAYFNARGVGFDDK